MFDWTSLASELDRWSTEGRTAKFWWRDDDAIEATPSLDKLLRLSETAKVPITLAVIPAFANISLAQVTEQLPQVSIAVHGYSHTNYAPKGEKKLELGTQRPTETVIAELTEGKAILEKLFPRGFNQALVPPWNRIDQEIIERIEELGFTALSTFQPIGSEQATSGVCQVNCHIDPIDWHGTRSLADPQNLIAYISALLERQRQGTIDNQEPLGLLTHHLVHDEAIWAFTEDFIKTIENHPSAKFVIGLERRNV